MKFGAVAAAKGAGAVLAHSVRAGTRRYAKGRILSAADVQALSVHHRQITVARLGKNDIGEDAAAELISAALVRANLLRAAKPVGGRVCLFAKTSGVLRVQAGRVFSVNSTANGAAALATAADFSPLREGEIAAALKIIPFAMAARDAAQVARLAAGALILHPYRARRAGLIQTTAPFVTRAAILDKTRRTTAARLSRYGAVLEMETRCAHRVADLTSALSQARESLGNDAMILIIGASAACDVRDVAPAAIVKSGGELLRLGMPVDPGNLAALGKLGGADVVLLPGSARSPQLSGADWILARLAAGMKVTAAHIAKMGVGGLLADIPQRPSPRILPPRRLRVHPVLLAAGSSRRMGRTNKLLADYRGMPLVRRAALNLANAAARGLFDDKQKEKKITVVTGCAAARVKEALAGIGAVFIHNPDYKTGMASSIRRALDSPEAAAADGLLIALADMPEVGADDFANIVGGFHPAAGRDIVVPSHQGKRGNPALIGRAHFPALAALRGDVGARAFLMEKAAFVAEVTAGAGVLFDVDDKGDLP